MHNAKMKRLFLGVILAALPVTAAEGQEMVLRESVFSTGAQTSGGDGMMLHSTIGEFGLGVVASNDLLIKAGYWPKVVNTAGPLAVPVAIDDVVATDEDTSVDISVLENDESADDSLRIASWTDGANGRVVQTDSTILTYTPNLNFFGEDSFVYRVANGAGGVAEATVLITVEAVNDPPQFVSNAQSAAVVGVEYSYTAVVRDVENDPLTIELADPPSWISSTTSTDTTLTVAGTPTADDLGEWMMNFDFSDGASSVRRSFVVIVTGSAPGLTELLLPEDGSTVSAHGDILLVWNSTAGATSYEVEIGETSDLSDKRLISNVTDTTVTLDIIPSNTTYYWRVKATNSIGEGEFSTTFSFTTATNVANESESDLPTVFELYQNYPNPFNPSTTITYDLPQSAEVRLVVYDAFGREVRTLVAARKAAGSHEVILDATDLATGSYFYRIQAGGLEPDNAVRAHPLGPTKKRGGRLRAVPLSARFRLSSFPGVREMQLRNDRRVV